MAELRGPRENGEGTSGRQGLGRAEPGQALFKPLDPRAVVAASRPSPPRAAAGALPKPT